MPRRYAFLLVGFLVLASGVTAASIAYPWAPRPSSDESSTIRAAATPSAPDTPLPKDAEDVAQALTKLATDPASVASKDMKAKIDPKVAIPPGSIVEPKPRTWAPDGLGGGTMTVSLTVPGEAPEKYLALMDKEPDGWKISMTMLLKDAPTSAATK